MPCINFYHDLFYKLGKKRIPSNILEFLTPISLAFWIQDDGSYHIRDHTLTLYTNSFSEAEVDLLIEALQKKFGLKCRKEKKGVRFVIIILTSSMDRVRELVLEHMDKSMLFKLGVKI